MPLGGLDRRLHGIGIALWLISLPYVFWWWTYSLTPRAGWLAAYLTMLAATGVVLGSRAENAGGS